MQCNKAREFMMAQTPAVEETAPETALQTHLEKCPDCRQFQISLTGVLSCFQQWEDESLPDDFRVPAVFPQVARPSPWLTWLPLAACLFLACLVVFRIQLTSDSGGFHISFGAVAQSAPERIPRTLAHEQIQRFQQQSLAQMRGILLQHRDESNARQRQWMERWAAKTAMERGQAYETLLESWENQRIKDMLKIEDQINLLLSGQYRNTSRLYNLANYVSQSPEPIE